MQLSDTDIFWDEQGNQIIKMEDGVELGVEGQLLWIETPCIIMEGCVVQANSIGSFTTIERKTKIAQDVEIGRYCTIGENCCIGIDDTNAGYLSTNVLFQWNLDIEESQKQTVLLNDITLIGNNVKIENDVTVRRGVSIGDGAIIRSNSIVENDVFPYSVVEGNPAKIRYYRFNKRIVEQLKSLHWWDYNAEVFSGLSGYVNIDDVGQIIRKVQTGTPDMDKTIICINDQKKQVIREQKGDKTVIYEEEYTGEQIRGGISKGTFYDAISKKLHVEGWLVPSRAYHEVEVYLGEKFLGKAQKHVLRKDVFRDHPEYRESRCGFVFEKRIEIEEEEIEITVIARKQDVTVIKRSEVIFRITQETLLCNGKLEYKFLKRIAMMTRCGISDFIKEIKTVDKRKILVCYGNCQIDNLVSLILTSEKLREIYLILYFPPVQSVDEEECKNGFPDTVIREIDLFIYQDVSRENKFSARLASIELIEKLREDAIRICIPNVYWTGYFPQFCANKYNPQLQGIRGGLFPYGDKNIHRLWREHDADEIVFILSQEDFYSKEEVMANAELSLQELRNREAVCDIKISDFIEAEYKEHYLFYTTNHPTNYLLKELVIRIFDHLLMKISDIHEEIAEENDSREIAIYPSVKKYLGLRFKKETFCWLTLIKNESLTFQDYVIDYIKYCKSERGTI